MAFSVCQNLPVLTGEGERGNSKDMTKWLVSLSVFLLASCGFQPMYGSHSQSSTLSTEASANMASIEIAMIPDREGQILRNELIDNLYPHGEPQNARYQMTFTELKTAIRELDLTKSSEATRSQVIATVNFNLIDRDTGEVLLVRPVHSISSYNILPSEFATNVTEDNARESALKDLARQIELQLSLYFNRERVAPEIVEKPDEITNKAN